MKRSFRQRIIAFSGLVSVLFLLTGVAYACSVAIDPNNPNADPFAERNFYGQIYSIGVLLLLPANILLAFCTRRRYLLGLLVAVMAVPLQILLFFGAMIFSDSCMESAHQFVKTEFIVLSFVFIAQIALFIFLKRKVKIILP